MKVRVCRDHWRLRLPRVPRPEPPVVVFEQTAWDDLTSYHDLHSSLSSRIVLLNAQLCPSFSQGNVASCCDLVAAANIFFRYDGKSE